VEGRPITSLPAAANEKAGEGEELGKEGRGAGLVSGVVRDGDEDAVGRGAAGHTAEVERIHLDTRTQRESTAAGKQAIV